MNDHKVLHSLSFALGSCNHKLVSYEENPELTGYQLGMISWLLSRLRGGEIDPQYDGYYLIPYYEAGHKWKEGVVSWDVVVKLSDGTGVLNSKYVWVKIEMMSFLA